MPREDREHEPACIEHLACPAPGISSGTRWTHMGSFTSPVSWEFMMRTAFRKFGVISQTRHTFFSRNYPMSGNLKRMECLWWLRMSGPLNSWTMLNTGEKSAEAALLSLHGAKCGSVTSTRSSSSVSDLTKAPAQLSALNYRWMTGILGFSEAPDNAGFFWPSSQRYLLIFVRFWDNLLSVTPL